MNTMFFPLNFVRAPSDLLSSPNLPCAKNLKDSPFGRPTYSVAVAPKFPGPRKQWGACCDGERHTRHFRVDLKRDLRRTDSFCTGLFARPAASPVPLTHFSLLLALCCCLLSCAVVCYCLASSIRSLMMGSIMVFCAGATELLAVPSILGIVCLWILRLFETIIKKTQDTNFNGQAQVPAPYHVACGVTCPQTSECHRKKPAQPARMEVDSSQAPRVPDGILRQTRCPC
jgi:hypothetical protein